MSVCGGCGKQWPVGTRVCPDDGSSLTPSMGDGFEATDPLGVPLMDKKAPTDPPVVTVGNAVAATAAGTDLAPGTMIGEYRVEQRIGQGGMAVVYSAVHPVIGKKAAIKVISHQLSTDDEAIKRFRQEARAVNQIGHLHIVDIFSFGSLADGRHYFVMELLQGESLSSRMERQRLSLAES